MADNTTLTTTTNSEGQNTTAPQSSDATGFTSGTPATIQPSTDSSLLLSTGGIPLQNSQLPTIAVAAKGTQTSTAAQSSAHHFNPALLTVPVLLLALAAVAVVMTNRAAKKTTKR